MKLFQVWAMVGAALLVGCQTTDGIVDQLCDLTIEADVVTFPATAVGVATPVSVTVSAGRADCKVTSVSVTNLDGTYFAEGDLGGGTDDSLTVPRDGNAEIPLIYAPAVEGFHTARVTVAVSNGREGNYEFQVRGHADTPTYAIYPRLIDFGAVPSSVPALGTVTIENQSDLDLVIDNFTFSAEDGINTTAELSNVILFPYTIPAGAIGQLDVRYTPVLVRKMAANLSVVIGGLNAQAIRLVANDCNSGVPSAYDKDMDGVTTCGGDCDDNDEDVNPSKTEGTLVNGKDDDCNGTVDDTTLGYDDDGDGYCENPRSCLPSGALPGDCNDGDANVNPGVEEECPSADPLCVDGIDNDCDGLVDAGTEDLDGDGYTDVAGDCAPIDETVFPGSREFPDGKDNDCDGFIDEGTVLYDDDGDSYCEGLSGTVGCSYGSATGDCDDSVNPLNLSDPFPGESVNPGEAEVPDYMDNNCDGEVDEGTPYGDNDGDGFVQGIPTDPWYNEIYADCDDANPNIGPQMYEVAGNGVDEDCDPTTGP